VLLAAFEAAYARLGIVYANIGQVSLSGKYYRKAFDLNAQPRNRS
jgi:Tfp pilus assembly protein PilF